jgi:hypothetical protein
MNKELFLYDLVICIEDYVNYDNKYYKGAVGQVVKTIFNDSINEYINIEFKDQGIYVGHSGNYSIDHWGLDEDKLIFKTKKFCSIYKYELKYFKKLKLLY